MMFAGRRIVLTTLEPVPRAFRAAPGVIVLNTAELTALERNQPGDHDILQEVVEICQAEDMADAMRTFKFKLRKVTAKTPKLAPSHRMALLNAACKLHGRKN